MPLFVGIAALAWRPARRHAALFPALVLAALFLARLPLLCYDILNPDEAFLLSSAMRVKIDPVAYRSFDPGTSGPLNIYLLSMPAWLGAPLIYVSSRMTGVLLVFGTLLFLWLAYRRFLDQRTASLALLPAFSFYLFAWDTDYVHCSSEHLAVFLSAAAVWLLARDYRNAGRGALWTSGAAGALGSSMVFAKLQALPLAAAILLLAALVAWRKPRRSGALAAVAGGAMAIPAFFLAMFLSSGALREFWLSEFGRNASYARLGGLSWFGKVQMAWELLFSISNMGAYELALAGVWAVAVVSAMIYAPGRPHEWGRGTHECAMPPSFPRSGILRWLRGGQSCPQPPSRRLTWLLRVPKPPAESRLQPSLAAPRFRQTACQRKPSGIVHEGVRHGAVASTLFLLAGFLAVATPGNQFMHYLLFLVVPSGLATATAVMSIQASAAGRVHRYAAGAAIAGFVCFTCIIPTALRDHMDDAWDHARYQPSTPLVRAIERYASAQDTLVVWGWRSELHVGSGRAPGTRFADSVMQIEPSPYREYFRRVYLDDFLRARPAVFVDAVGPDAFTYTDRAATGYETFEGLREAVTRDYRQIGELDGARLFVRNDRTAVSTASPQ